MESTNLTELQITSEYEGIFATELLPSLNTIIEPFAEVELRVEYGCQPKGTTISPGYGELLPSSQMNVGSSNALPESLRDNWNGLAASQLSVEAFGRISRLARKPNGWRGLASKKLSSESLHNFLGLWKHIQGNAAEPFLTLAPNGNLYVEWHASWKRHLDIEFADDDMVFFGLFHGGDVVEGKSQTLELVNAMLSRRQNPFCWRYMAK